MSHFGPTRGELLFRLAFSLVGLAGTGFAVAYRGIKGIAGFEIVAIAILFFGGTVIWSAYRLWKTR